MGDDIDTVPAAECPAGCKDATFCEAAEPQTRCPLSHWLINAYIARVYRNGKAIYITPRAYPTRMEAAMDAFKHYPHATTCSTARATKIDGQWSDRGGFDIQFHTKGIRI